ncbi:MAG: hypothetical protein HY327_00780 [Chloroflexi bacterium]|nr:hypothetical protein [Chloroflexota bacterium]
MKNGMLIVAAVFAVALAVVVGNRLSNDAMAVVVGAFCGLMASVPFTVALVIALKQNWGQPPARHDPFGNPPFPNSQPPVLIINPSQMPPQPYGFQPNQIYLPPAAPPSGAPRDFKIIGEE